MKKCLCPMGGGILLFNLVFRRSSDAITASSHTFPLPLRRQAAFFRWRQSRTFYKTQWLGHSAQTPTAGFSYIRPLRHPPEPHPSFYFRSHSANFPEANGCRSIPRIPPWLPLSPHPTRRCSAVYGLFREYTHCLSFPPTVFDTSPLLWKNLYTCPAFPAVKCSGKLLSSFPFEYRLDFFVSAGNLSNFNQRDSSKRITECRIPLKTFISSANWKSLNCLDGIPGLFHFLPCLAEKEGFGTLGNECRLGGIQQVSTGHLHLIVQISPSYFRQKENPIR